MMFDHAGPMTTMEIVVVQVISFAGCGLVLLIEHLRGKKE
jgi:hypothetical protein